MTQEVRLVAIGDSIIRGTDDIEKGGWIDRVKEVLLKTYPKLIVFKKGVGGDTSKGVLARLHEDCIDLAPAVVVIGVGVNDSRRRESLGDVAEISLAEFNSAVEAIVKELRESTEAAIILSSMVPVDHRGETYKEDKTHHREDQFAYAEATKQIAQRHGLEYIDHFSRWLAYGDSKITRMLVDGVHPTSEGHADMAEAAVPIVASAIASKFNDK